ncbi:hypothetical protein PILCRDRAFT_173868 [Piloderma croceum F 1598]|uniref:Uncharacterized protein n=1 Tax=Piloderma croceum (strain F 1598) TaxID=765440 RepID=A0A0C3G1M8_PILCF|nr:hypothetical protein PILCRDRAFT_173868 [Piloderma croceum F 1598]
MHYLCYSLAPYLTHIHFSSAPILPARVTSPASSKVHTTYAIHTLYLGICFFAYCSVQLRQLYISLTLSLLGSGLHTLRVCLHLHFVFYVAIAKYPHPSKSTITDILNTWIGHR